VNARALSAESTVSPMRLPSWRTAGPLSAISPSRTGTRPFWTVTRPYVSGLAASSTTAVGSPMPCAVRSGTAVTATGSNRLPGGSAASTSAAVGGGSGSAPGPDPVWSVCQ
jgi:hypothetical protein